MSPANLDLVGPFRGACGMCGGPDARHRMYDAVRERVKAGDPVDFVALDYEQDVAWVKAIVDEPESEWTIWIPVVHHDRGKLRGKPAWLNENDRRHWAQQGKLVAEWRNTAGWQAKAAGLPKLGKARIDAFLHFTDRRHRDPANWTPTIKACVDGIVQDAGVLPDDSAAYLDGPFIHLGEPLKPVALELVIREAVA